MDSKFIVQRGCLYNTIEALKKKKITIGFLGGSITEAKDYQRWSENVVNWFVSTFPDTAVDVENAAIGGTGSDSAVFRVERDIINRGCALVFLEYAVNDEDKPAEIRKRAREGLLRKLLKSGHTDVIITYSFNQNMYTYLIKGELPETIAEFELLAEHYMISSVFMGSYALNELKSGKLRWEEWLPDGLHPQHMGSYIYSLPVAELLESELIKPENTKKMLCGKQLPKAMDEDNWEKAAVLPFEEVQRIGRWRLYRASALPFVDRILRTAAIGSRLSFEFEGKGFCMTFDFGWFSSEYKYRIDGCEWLDSNRKRPEWISGGGWLRTDIVAYDLKYGRHSVEVEVTHGNGDLCKGSNFELCGIGIVK